MAYGGGRPLFHALIISNARYRAKTFTQLDSKIQQNAARGRKTTTSCPWDPGLHEWEESQMPGTISATLLWLFVINLGAALGAGLYEHRIVVSRWITSSQSSGSHWNADAARRDDTGRRFWAFVTTVPLTLLTLA